MSNHPSHIMHDNSLHSWRSLPDMSEREAAIMEIYEKSTHPLTDRQIAGALRVADMNYVRPRITGLLQKRVLVERGTVRDVRTGRKVRRCELAPHLVESRQLALPL